MITLPVQQANDAIIKKQQEVIDANKKLIELEARQIELIKETSNQPDVIELEKANQTGVSVFNFENHNVRTVVAENGEVWFVANDVAVALGYKKPNNAIHAHCDMDTLKQGDLQTAGGIQSVRLINESNIFRLVFSSKLESSKRFTKWVTSEVLPAIRKTGKYEVVHPVVTQPHISISELNQQFKDARELAFNRGFQNGQASDKAVELLKHATGVDYLVDKIIVQVSHQGGIVLSK